ncbi:MAG: hypothetical protein EBR02_00210 [Alphaproteobacteria bacterium]|nr:hypothetical protein [Alphaproteobacteria bacterium]
MDSPFVASPEAVEGAHSTYLVKNNDELYLFNSSSSDPDGYYYPMKEIDNGKYMFEKWTLQVSREPFKNLGYQYSLDKTDAGQWMLSACKVTNSKECSEIEIAPDSAVFSYGGNNVNTVAVTNKADVLFHSKNGWCRGEKTTNGGYKCNKEMTAITAHGGWQIYSSIKTKDGTLMGEFPTGRFWLLGDGVLHPTSLSPYNKDSHENLELQSVALFCGDLYAGFWPRGEVWEKPLDSNQWKEPQRLFTSPLGLKKGEIPYKDLLESRAYGVYDTNTMFGQRATSMATYGNSLLVATGNLGNWHKDVKRPWFMSKSQADEYGKIHIKTDSNCLTTFVDDKVRLNIQINSNTLSVYNDGYKIAETLLHDFDSSKITHFKIGEGVFGPLSDKQIKVNILNNSI